MKITAGELAKKLQAVLIGDENTVISKIGEIEDCENPETVVIAVEPKALKKLSAYQPKIVVLKEDIPELNSVKIVSARGKEVLVEALQILYPEEQKGFISPEAFISKSAVLGKDLKIFPGVYIGENVSIGDNTAIYSNTVIYDNCRVGRNCLIHAGSVIGADGFGFIQKDGRNIKVPQKGQVIIEDDVEIGAGTTIDRATLKATVIGSGTKIDNKVQVGHNVRIGRNCIIVAGANIGGSSILEDNVILAGGAGVVDNITIGANSIVYAYTVATKDAPANSRIYGTPAGDDYHAVMKRRAAYNRLPELLEGKKAKPKKKK